MKKVLVFFLSVFFSFEAFSQEIDQEKREKTIEEQYLQNMELGILREQASSSSREMNYIALSGIEEMINNGEISEDNEALNEIMDRLAGEGTLYVTKKSGINTNDYPDIRRKACELLGRIGGEGAAEILKNVIIHEKEPMVISEALYALGKIGENDKNQTLLLISYFINLQTFSSTPDNNLAYAGLLAIEKIVAKNGGLAGTEDQSDLSPLFSAIVGVADGKYNNVVKSKARELMGTIKQYK